MKETPDNVTRVGFTGHQGLTPETVAAVADEIDRQLGGLGVAFDGVCSLAEGADQIFAQSVIKHAGRLMAIIPCVGYEETFSNDNDLEQYRSLLAKASSTRQLGFSEPSEEAFWSAGKAVVESCDRLLAVWNGEPVGGLGGTADVVKYARQLSKPLIIIWPEGASRA